ncbi:MAG: extracellular solute-binding protein [Moorella humiferrea]|nr:extracellular solute-binding protein [Moorella humiferrea]
MQRRKLWVFGVLLLLAVITTGCGGQKASQTPESKAGQGAEENKLVIYTAREKGVTDIVIPKFEERYPEYKGQVQVLSMGAQEILERVRAEKENPQGDVWWGGTQQALGLAAKEGLLATLKPSFAEKIPAAYKDPGGMWYGEILLPEVIMYNTQALKPEDVPKDWDDLLDAKWKDKIIIRGVTASGTMRTIYAAMIYRFFKEDGKPDRGFEWLKKLDANTKEYTPNPTTLYLKLARQEGVLSLWNMQDILIQKDQKGMPFGYVIPASGAPILVDGVAVIKGAKHPKAAEKFLEFLFEEKMQVELAEKAFQIPAIKINEAQLPQWLKGVNLKALDLNWDVMASKEKEWIEYWDQNIKGKGRQ